MCSGHVDAMTHGDRPVFPHRLLVLGAGCDDLAPAKGSGGVALLRGKGLEHLPLPLGRGDCLLASLAWMDALAPAQRDELARLGRACGAWVAFTEAATRIGDQLHWRRRGVGHFFPLPRTPQELSLLLAALAEEVPPMPPAGQGRVPGDALLRSILDQLPFAVFWKDVDSRYLGGNRGFAGEVGLDDPGLIAGRDDFDLFEPALAEAYRRGDREVLDGMQPRLGELQASPAGEGGQRWLSVNKLPLRDARGHVAGVLGVCLDITGFKQAERALSDSQARYRFFLDNVDEGVVVCERGIIVDVSDRWLELFRCQREQAIGQPVMDFTGPSAVPMALQLIDEKWSESYESVMLRKDGSSFPAIVRGRDQRFGGRELRLTTILDITRQKEAERALKVAKAEAERANRAKSEFLSSMSHELRTPMNAILGFAQILEFDEGLDADQRDNVGEILKAGRHLLGLINEVLDLARVESGNLPMSIEPVELGELIRDCRQLVQPLAEDRKITLRLDLPEPVAVRADHVRLKQVLLNLLSNAIKYNRDGGRVRVSVETLPQRLRIVVADTGQGLQRKQLDGLFQPFNRLGAERGAVEGTGIGLVIARKLVEAMHGRIGVESEPDRGSRFWLELPSAEALPEVPASVPPPVVPAGQAAGQARQRILYIDDNPVNLRLVTQILEKLRRIQLVTRQAPGPGIEYALAQRPDLILLDINLPDMDGYAVLDVLRSHPLLRPVPVIAVSANAMPRDIERGMAAGFSDYLTKPLDIGRFLASIDSHLRPEH